MDRLDHRFVLFNSNKSQLAAYHLRQTLALMILGILVYIVQIMLIFYHRSSAGLLLFYYGLASLFLWVLGLVAAINGEKKPILRYWTNGTEYVCWH